MLDRLSRIALALASAADAAQAQAPLAPSSSWNVDYAESECRLSRTFGPADDTITLRIIRGASLKAVEYTLAGTSLKIRDWNYNVLLRLGPDGTSHKLPVLSYRLPTGEGALQIIGENELRPAEIASTRTLSVELDGAEPLQLAVGSLDKPFAALNACYDDLLTSWGIDPTKVRDLKTAARPLNMQSWSIFENIWASDAAKGSKWMTIRLDVNEIGKAQTCKTLASSGSAELDAKICAAAIKKARFVPAASASGEKVGAPFVLRIQMRE